MPDAAPMKAEIQVFDDDAAKIDGYVYTTDPRLSSRLATKNLEDLILNSVSFEGKSVLDIGCGDGHFTRRFFDRGRPSSMVGMDPAPNAVAVAKAHNEGVENLDFVVGNGHRLKWTDGTFDLAVIQGVLHHDDKPWETIKEAFRVAREVVILEPNGNNMGLKVIEKVSKYHRDHHERSYPTLRLLGWIRNGGGTITSVKFGGFVPMFCPDWIARLTKKIEPVLEKTPVARTLGCAVVVVVAKRYA